MTENNFYKRHVVNMKQGKTLLGCLGLLVILNVFFSPVPVSAQEGALSFESLLEAARDVTLTARTTGIIKEVRIKEGKQVSSGEVLVIMEDDEEQAEYKRAKARLEYTEAAFDADKKLYDKEAISRIKYLESQSRLTEAEAAMKRAELNLKKTRITAPFNGVVTVKKSVEAGQLVNINSDVCSVVKFEPLKIIIYIPEQYSSRFDIGSKAEITSKYNKNLRAEAVVTEKSPVIDPASSTSKLKLVVQSNPGGFVPGMHVTVVLRPVSQ